MLPFRDELALFRAVKLGRMRIAPRYPAPSVFRADGRSHGGSLAGLKFRESPTLTMCTNPATVAMPSWLGRTGLLLPPQGDDGEYVQGQWVHPRPQGGRQPTASSIDAGWAPRIMNCSGKCPVKRAAPRRSRRSTSWGDMAPPGKGPRQPPVRCSRGAETPCFKQALRAP